MSQTSASPIPSRSGPLGIFVGGLILLVAAALSAWVLPNVLVFNQQMQQMEGESSPSDFWGGEVNSGQSTDIPEGYMISLQPESMWLNVDPMSTEMPEAPDCTVEGPSGAVELIDVYGMPGFEAVESGSYKIECEGGGMIYLSGESAENFHRQDGWTRTLTILMWVTRIGLVGGILLSVAGAYLLGERNVQRKIALERVYAEVAPTYPATPGAPAAASGPVASAAPAADGALPAPAAGESPAAPPQPPLPPVTRPKNSRQQRDPFAD